MNQYNGVFSPKHSAPHHGLLTVLELLTDTIVVCVNGCQTFKTLTEARRETAVRPHAGTHKGVSASGSGGLKHSNESGPGGLLLGTLVCVPLNWATTGPGLADSEITRRSISLVGLVALVKNAFALLLVIVNNHVFFGTRSRMRGPTVNVQRTKMTDKFLLCFEADIHKILITEYQGTSLSSKKG